MAPLRPSRGTRRSRQLDLIGSDQPRALDVDQLAVEQVTLEQHLLGTAFERAQVELGLAHDNATGADLRDAVGAQKGGTTCDVRQEAGDRGVAGPAEAHDQILDLAQTLAVGIAQRAADDRGEVQDRGLLGGGQAHSAHRTRDMH
jgi:hypothetical protein